MEQIIFIVILIGSVVIHELAHGYTADALGDPTPSLAGRLTLNPLAHLDPFGSVILPALLIFSGVPFVFGWAKPVPFNPNYLKSKRWGGAIVALAGPLSNLVLAGIFALLLKLAPLSIVMTNFFEGIVMVNIVLAVFNLVPLPPLDGHHILFAALGNRFLELQNFLKKYSFIFLVLFIFFGWKYLNPIFVWLAQFFLS